MLEGWQERFVTLQASVVGSIEFKTSPSSHFGGQTATRPKAAVCSYRPTNRKYRTFHPPLKLPSMNQPFNADNPSAKRRKILGSAQKESRCLSKLVPVSKQFCRTATFQLKTCYLYTILNKACSLSQLRIKELRSKMLHPGKGNSFSKPSFSGSMLNFGRVVRILGPFFSVEGLVPGLLCVPYSIRLCKVGHSWQHFPLAVFLHVLQCFLWPAKDAMESLDSNVAPHIGMLIPDSYEPTFHQRPYQPYLN